MAKNKLPTKYLKKKKKMIVKYLRKIVWQLPIALNVLYAKDEKIYPAYVSKQNFSCEKQVILSIILNEEG